MSADRPAEPIDYILNSQLSGVLSKGFAELYRAKPDFPVSYLAKWLHTYSQTQKDKETKKKTVADYSNQLEELEKQRNQKKALQQKEIENKKSENLKSQDQYKGKLQSTERLEDLLTKWLPEYIEKRYKLTGSYVGNLTHPHKPLQMHNFEPGAELDTENPQIVEYIGASSSQEKTMLMKVLPNETGVSYECFNEPQPQPEAEEGGQNPAPKEAKKTYVFVPDVTKNEKVYYFKYPKLGSYACFPIKLNSYLNIAAFDQGIIDYKEYLSTKENNDRQYNEKLVEVRHEYDEAKKKYEDFEVPEDEPNPDAEAEKNNLKDQAQKAEQRLAQVQNNPPVTPQPNFNTIKKVFMLGCDTLGQDRKLTDLQLNQIDTKVKEFVRCFEEKQKKMLLKDILTYIDEQNKIDALQNQYRDFQKNVLSQAQQATKQKFTKQKQLEYETSAFKWRKMEGIFEETGFEKSMKTYFSYNTPKYQQILQIALMFLRYEKTDINLPRSNILDFRKVREEKFLQRFFQKMGEYNLAPEGTEQCNEQYRINKLMERLQKIDLEQVLKYNGFLWALANHVKGLCWTRIQCRDSNIEAHQLSIKAKQEREAQIEKYKQQLEKALEAHKSELSEEDQAAFKEEDWRANYASENPIPEPLAEIERKKFLDIE